MSQAGKEKFIRRPSKNPARRLTIRGTVRLIGMFSGADGLEMQRWISWALTFQAAASSALTSPRPRSDRSSPVGCRPPTTGADGLGNVAKCRYADRKLGMPGCFDAFHRPLALPVGLMRVLGAISSGTSTGDGPPTASPRGGRPRSRRACRSLAPAARTASPEQSAEEFLGGLSAKVITFEALAMASGRLAGTRSGW